MLGALALLVFLASVLIICASWAFIAHQPRYRARIDATKTRAYSLSPQTQALLDSLQGPWTISIVLAPRDVDRAVLRQVEEVLERYREASDRVSVERIDPTDPASLAAYERLLQRLRELYRVEIEQYEEHLARAREAYAGLVPFAAAEANALDRLIGMVGAEGAIGAELAAVQRFHTAVAQNGPQVLAAVADALATDESRPLADYERARDVLHAALSEAVAGVSQIGSRYAARASAAGLPDDLRAHLSAGAEAHQQLAAQLQRAADPLLHLRPLDLSRINDELSRGEAAVIAGSGRAAVIPAWQLLPRSNLRQTRTGAITFDQRFRGEQLLSSTIRSLTVDRMPLVVFVHAAAESVLRESRDRKDLFGATSILQAGRYEVREWRPEEVARPEPAPGQRAVWVIVPPVLGGRGGNPAVKSKEELLLIERTRQLIDEGEPVLISFQPSVMHKLRQPDPWQGLLAGFDIEVDTSRVIFQAQMNQSGQRIAVPTADVIETAGDHPIARAMTGQLLRLTWPMPITVNDSEWSRRHVIAAAEAGDDRWAEEEWLTTFAAAGEGAVIEGEKSLSEALPIVVAAERPHPLNSGGGGDGETQRIVAVGSGNWMQTVLADMVIALGGERVALQFPGNYELLQASVAWLAGMDDLIAQSPTSQQVSRLEGISDRDRRLWQWLAMAGLPGAALLLGLVVWLIRRV